MTGAERTEPMLVERLVVQGIAQHCVDSTAHRAALRRHQGVPLDEARDVLWFRHLMAQIRRDAQGKGMRYVPRDELAFLVGTLLADDRAALKLLDEGKAVQATPCNLGASLNEIERAQAPDAYKEKIRLQPDPHRRESRFERRLRLLIDAGLETDGTGELPFRLRQTVRLILAQRDGRAYVDWVQLLRDLGRWNWQGKPVQRDWARFFYGDPLATHGEDDVTEGAGDQASSPADD